MFVGLSGKVRAWRPSPLEAGVCLAALFLLSVALVAPIDRKGDASEYILGTESLYFDHDLIFDDHDVERNARLRPESLLDIPLGLDAIPGSDGKARYGLHSFYYAAAMLPFYALFGHRGFLVFNACAVLGLVAAVGAFYSRTEQQLRAVAFSIGAVFFSAAWSYVFFTSTEAFYAGLLGAFFFFWRTDRPKRAALFGGVAFAAQLPTGAFAAPFIWELARTRRWRDAALCCVVIVAYVAPQLYYNVHWLGGLFPMHTSGNAQLGHIEPAIVLRTLFDPGMGVVWFFPVAFYCLLNVERNARTALLGAACALVVLGMNTPSNVYSHQVGMRFGMYLFPALLFSVNRLDTEKLVSRLAIALTVFVGAGLAMNPLGNSAGMDLRGATFVPYRIASHFEAFYDNPEVFIAASRALDAGRVYARDTFQDGWTLGGAPARILLQGAAKGRLELELASWGRTDRLQHIRIRLHSSRVIEGALPPNGVATAIIDLHDADVVHYDRFPQSELAYVDIDAEAWVPKWDAPQLSTDDRRRLGVRLVAVRSNGHTLSVIR